jgi:hypothetical protein
MPIDRKAVQDRLKKFDFPALFTQELGWYWHTNHLTITLDGQPLTSNAVAHKRGMVAYHCPSPLGKQTGVNREEFDTYFKGKDEAHALLIEEAWPLRKPVRLACLRKEKRGFRPAQSFHYIRGAGFPSSFGILLPN